ncbi:MAG: hypothetical protein ACREDT_00595 [Methylocella sp.]
MKRLLLAAAATFITPVHAGGCDEETIRGVARGGSVVILDSGAVYEVEPHDTSDTALWNAGDSVLLCGGDKMINKENGDKVYVTPLR